MKVTCQFCYAVYDPTLSGHTCQLLRAAADHGSTDVRSYGDVVFDRPSADPEYDDGLGRGESPRRRGVVRDEATYRQDLTEAAPFEELHQKAAITLKDLQRQSIRDSRAWFPEVHSSTSEAVVHFALGIAGEVGELVNFIKKVNRGSTTFEAVHDQVRFEMADVLIYLCDMAEELGIDLEQAVADKREILIDRWGHPDTISEGNE